MNVQRKLIPTIDKLHQNHFHKKCYFCVPNA